MLLVEGLEAYEVACLTTTAEDGCWYGVAGILHASIAIQHRLSYRSDMSKHDVHEHQPLHCLVLVIVSLHITTAHTTNQST